MTSGDLVRPGKLSGEVVVRETNPKVALEKLRDFVTKAGVGSIRTVHLNSTGTLLIWHNGTALAAQHYPALACGKPSAAIYVWWMFEALGKPDIYDILTVSKAIKLSIDLTA